MRTRKRIAVAVITGVMLAGVVAGYIHFRYSRPVGDGPAGPAIARNLFAQPWSSRSVLLVGLGDSVTAGFGARKGYSYFDRLVSNPPDEFAEMEGMCLKTVLPGMLVTNLSVSGSTSFEHVEKQLPNLQTNADLTAIIVLTTGGNDLIHNYGRTPPRQQAMYGASWEQAEPWIAEFEQRLSLMITQVRFRFPAGCHIFLANIYDPTDGVGDIENAGLPEWKEGKRILSAYNEVIRQTADKYEYVHLVDIHSAFLGHGIHCTQFWRRHYDSKDPHYWYYHNLEDPNERGYDAIRRLFLLEIAEVAEQLR